MKKNKSKTEGKIICPKCKKPIIPHVTKYGIGGDATQRTCPLCGKRVGRPKGVACCFVATAAYGSPLDERVQILCKFRDIYLSKNILGRLFIEFYYSVSPKIAKHISESKYRRKIVRSCLYPIVFLVEKRISKSNDKKYID